MTDDVAAPSRPNLVPAPRPVIANPWVNGLGVAGFLLILAGGINFLIPPAASSQADGSSIVNFPAMFMQYGLGLGVIILGAALVAAWGLAGALEWRARRPIR